MDIVESIFAQSKSGSLFASSLIPGEKSFEKKMDIISPIDKSKIGILELSSEEQLNNSVTQARKSFNSGEWSEMAPADRKMILLKWVSLIEEHALEIAALDCVDAGKPITECINTDMPATIETFRWYSEIVDKCYGKIAPTGSDATALIIDEPIGVVGAVLPWNFPAQMYAWKVAPALAAGNSVIVKPAELTSLSAYRLTQLAHEAGVPKGALILVTGFGEDIGQALGLHPDIDVVSFTGSTEVGRLFLKYSADSNLKEIVLECGGKSPQIVFDDANVDDNLLDNVLSAAFWNMAENCSAGGRLLVQDTIKDVLLKALIDRLASWKVGNPMDPEVSIGPLVEEAHFDKVKSFIDDSLKQGAKLIAGGSIRNDIGSGWYIEPTIFDDVSPNMRLFQEEVFGPILGVTTFTDEDQAIELANNCDYGLASSIYTTSLHKANRVSRKINAGTVSVNCFSEGDITVPFGGYKKSGFGGKDKGVEALSQYTRRKVIWYENV